VTAIAALGLVLGLGACTAARVPAGRAPTPRPAPVPTFTLAQYRQLAIGQTQLQATGIIPLSRCTLTSTFSDGIDTFTDYDCENGAPFYSGLLIGFTNGRVDTLGEWGLS
jgi:hypothetical protein